MTQISLLNWLIYALVVLGVIQLIYIAHQQGDADTKKTEMKQKLDYLLLQLNGQIKDFNSSVSTLQSQHSQKLRTPTQQLPTLNKRHAPFDSRVTDGGLFAPTVPLPKPARVPIQATPLPANRLPDVPRGSGKLQRALLFTMDSISSCK
jgi:hypothetical protein